ncbi:MAG: hypothetical protein NT049_11560, partial [Planctomycetota bacterium]|nr:hypothetical protein [Planctomycetota bacterium]
MTRIQPISRLANGFFGVHHVAHVQHDDFRKALRDRGLGRKPIRIKDLRKVGFAAHNPKVAGSNPAPATML